MGVPPNFTETQMLDCWLYSTISPIMCAYIYNICVCVYPMKSLLLMVKLLANHDSCLTLRHSGATDRARLL